MTRLMILRITTALGLFMSLYLVRQHIQYELTGKVESGLCKIATEVSSKLDCSKIESSAFSDVYGVPTASFGALYFLAFALHLWIGRPRARVQGEEDNPLTDPFWCVVALYSAAGLLVSILLAAISGFIIGGFCSGCAIVYLICLANVALAIRMSLVEFIAMTISGLPALWTGFVRAFGDNRAAGTGPVRAAVALYLFAAVPLALGVPPIWVARSRSAQAIKDYQAQRVIKFRHNDLMIADGPANAPLEIVLFADFKCPGCKAFRPKLKETLAKFPKEQYRYIHKFFPMEPLCNPLVQKLGIAGHPGACDLAAMGQALNQLGKFWEFSADLYEVKERNVYESLKGIAQKAGIDYLEWVRLARENPTNNPIMKQVGSDAYEGSAIQFAELPALFINGRFVNTHKPEVIEAVMKFELDRVAKGESAPPHAAPPPGGATPATAPPAAPAPAAAPAPPSGGPPSTLEP